MARRLTFDYIIQNRYRCICSHIHVLVTLTQLQQGLADKRTSNTNAAFKLCGLFPCTLKKKHTHTSGSSSLLLQEFLAQAPRYSFLAASFCESYMRCIVSVLLTATKATSGYLTASYEWKKKRTGKAYWSAMNGFSLAALHSLLFCLGTTWKMFTKVSRQGTSGSRRKGSSISNKKRKKTPAKPCQRTWHKRRYVSQFCRLPKDRRACRWKRVARS